MSGQPSARKRTGCKSCGGTNHARASSEKCANHVPCQKKRFVDAAQAVISNFAIKMCLWGFCGKPPSAERSPNRELSPLEQRIESDVLTLSALFVEVTIYVHFHYTQLLHRGEFGCFQMPFTLSHLQDFYYHLQGKHPPKQRIPRNEEFFALRNRNEYYDGTYRTYLVSNMVAQHMTTMMNCITVHMFGRVARYMYERYKDEGPLEARQSRGQWRARVYRELFSNETPLDQRSAQIQEFLRDFELPADWRFENLKSCWWSLVPMTFKLGQWFAARNLRSFSVFPVASPGRKHIRYNAMALHQLLRATNLIEPNTEKEFRGNAPTYWFRHFNLSAARYGQLVAGKPPQIVPHNGRTAFGMAFTTNGVDCSVDMMRYMQPSSEGPSPRRAKRRKVAAIESDATVDISQYDAFLGIDPGVVNFVGACLVKLPRDLPTRQQKLALRTATFREAECRERARRRKRLKLSGEHERELLTYRNEIKEQRNIVVTSKCSETHEESLEYTKYRLRFFVASQAIYASRKYCRLGWDSKILHRRALDRLVNQLLTLGPAQRILVCFGDGSRLQPGVSYGRALRPATGALRAAFHRRRDRCDVLDVDEYMTSQMCATCNQRIPLPRRPVAEPGFRHHRRRREPRVQVCQNCRIRVNRDINAARNIVLVGTKTVQYRQTLEQRPCSGHDPADDRR